MSTAKSQDDEYSNFHDDVAYLQGLVDISMHKINVSDCRKKLINCLDESRQRRKLFSRQTFKNNPQQGTKLPNASYLIRPNSSIEQSETRSVISIERSQAKFRQESQVNNINQWPPSGKLPRPKSSVPTSSHHRTSSKANNKLGNFFDDTFVSNSRPQIFKSSKVVPSDCADNKSTEYERPCDERIINDHHTNDNIESKLRRKEAHTLNTILNEIYSASDESNGAKYSSIEAQNNNLPNLPNDGHLYMDDVSTGISDVDYIKVIPSSDISVLMYWMKSYEKEMASYDSMALFAELRLRELLIQERHHGRNPSHLKAAVCADLLLKLCGRIGRYSSIITPVVHELLNCIYIDYGERTRSGKLPQSVDEFYRLESYLNAYTKLKAHEQKLELMRN